MLNSLTSGYIIIWSLVSKSLREGGGGGGREGLSNVGYTGMCHRAGVDFTLSTIQNRPRIWHLFPGSSPDFFNITQEQDPFLTIWSQTSEMPFAFLKKMTGPILIFFLKSMSVSSKRHWARWTKTACDVTISPESYHQNCAASESPEEKIEGNKDWVRFLGKLPFWKTQLHFSLLFLILEPLI